ncbi:MAG: MMPL family transporter [Thermoleophilia bacterium]
MSPVTTSRNLAARMGRWSVAHRKTAIFGWLVFVVVAFSLSIVSPMTTISDTDRGVGESGRADKILDAAFDLDEAGLGEFVVVRSDTLTVDDPGFRATVTDVIRAVGRFDQVSDIESPFAAGNDGQVSPDRHAAMITFTPEGDAAEAFTYIDDVVAAVEDVQDAHPDLVVAQAGVSTEKELGEIVKSQLSRAGLIAIPLTILILLIVMGTGYGAMVPVLLGLTSVLATMGLVSLPSAIIPMDAQINEVILLVGLAVGVDYAIFYMRRKRDERRAGRTEPDALAIAAATSGRAVLISGITVMIAMAGMFFSGDTTFMSFAIGAMMVVFVAMIGSLTVLPAILSVLGDRTDHTRIPLLRRRARRAAARDGESRLWGAILRPVLRHPVVSTIAASAVLVVMALPALQLHPAESGLDAMPRSLPALEAFHVIDDSFPGGVNAAVVAVRSDDPEAAEAQIAELERRALATGEMVEPITAERSDDGTTWQVSIPLAGEGTDAVSDHALATLRTEVIPATIGTLPGADYGVTGGTASSRDFTDAMKDSAPLVFGFVMLFAFLLLLAAFRSIIVALKAIVLNLLSVAAAYGVMVAVFQWGWGQDVLDFNPTGGIASWLPMFLFVILFGLSMDYHVFILSKVRELYDRGMSTRDAVEHGIRSTAGVVTGAAVVMIAVFSVFAMLPILDMKEMGIGLATAILIDATIVRAVLLPASMTLLGDRNWYLPRWLGWLPRLEHERAPETAAPGSLPQGA